MNMKVDEENGKASGMMQWILEEHGLSCFRYYFWSWGVKAVGEVIGTEDICKEE